MSEPDAAAANFELELKELRIAGALDDRWAGRFEGLTMTRDAHGNTLLAGPVVDQAALLRLLRNVRDLGLPLLALVCTRCDAAAEIDKQ